MAQSPDPAKEDFLRGGKVTRTSSVAGAQRKHVEIEKRKRQLFSQCVDTCQMDKEDVYRMLKIAKENSSGSFDTGYLDICELLPSAFCSRADCRAIFDLLRDGDGESVDSRDLIMTFTNFVADFGLEEKCKLAFEMFDVDRSGYLSIDEVISMMTSTNLSSRELIKKRAENFMICADTDRCVLFPLAPCPPCAIIPLSPAVRLILPLCSSSLARRSGGITIDELIVAAEKLPNLLYPPQMK